MLDFDRLTAAYERAKADLLAERTPDGHWVGELSSSALSTATAVSALALVKAATIGRGSQPRGVDELDSLIHRGVNYLTAQQNPDGGYGDTDLSHSNIATTYLVVAALHLAGVADQHAALLRRADAYLESKGRLAGLRKRYGIDKTFVVPIMTNLALAGLVDWKEIDALPFELACVPQSWYRFVGMPVVSYAIPALVAIGQARYFHAPPWNPFTRLLRWLSITRSLQVLRRMQPGSGGYLEATPLTSFVVMSLGSLQAPREDGISRSEMPTVADEVIREGVKFLINSIRPDGSWPIDTNLATWNTTLAINALAAAGEELNAIVNDEGLVWLLGCQHRDRHPFTGADPGGFGWTNLSGAVPDADDTPGALLALMSIINACESQTGFLLAAFFNVEDGLQWLTRLQNRNGGWPTFCRGWGKLPFDRSGTDLTAHALRALARYRHSIPNEDPSKGMVIAPSEIDSSMQRGLAFISSKQHPNGSWSPLWFGNQDHPEEDNPVYGTAKVLMAYRDLGLMDSPEAQRGVAWLVGNQNADGGWGSGAWGRAGELKNANCKLQIANCGADREHQAERAERARAESVDSVTGLAGSGHSVAGTHSVLSTGQNDAVSGQSPVPNPQSQIAPAPICNLQFAITNLQSSVEETALAVEALLAACPSGHWPLATGPLPSAVARGLAWLIDRVEADQHRQPAPIGFYFAKLWYYERLYPVTFTVAALGRACRQFAHPAQLDSHAEEAPARAP